MGNILLYQVDNLPVQQNRMFESAELAKSCLKGSIRLIQDESTGLVYNADYDPNLLSYDRSYQNEQACSRVFQQHLGEVAKIISPFFKDKSAIEVGCGKGWFLEFLRAQGFSVIGVDPAYEGDSPHVIKAEFSAIQGMKVKGIILRHTLEHIPDPIGFLQAIAESNEHQGIIYIEVPCLDWIAANRAWFDIYYEHVNYFRLADLKSIFRKVYRAGRLFGDQYLYIVADLASIMRPQMKDYDLFSLPGDFQKGIAAGVDLLKAKGTRKVAVWGGASKGVLFSYFLSRGGYQPDFIIDINPAKQGKFLPATGLLVSSPETALKEMISNDFILVMNSNYLTEIKCSAGQQYQYIVVDNG
jgi:hypothetical protein